MSVILSGSAFQRPAGEPSTLSSLLLARIDRNPDSRFIEISQTGERATRTTAELYRRALAILLQLRQRALADDSDVVLCFDNVLDFIPAAWACICGGYSWIPWHLPKHSSDKDIRSRLQVLDRKLNEPVLLATDRIKTRIASLGAWPRILLSVDWDSGQQFDATSCEQGAPRAETIDAAILVLTSGTTGTPKIAMLSHDSVLNRYFSRPEPRPGRTRINCFPFDGVTGLWIIFPSAADTIYMQPARLAAQPLDLLKIVDELGVNGLSLSTSLAARIQEAAENVSGTLDLSSLDNVGFGSEMIIPKVILKFGRMLRQMGAHKLKIALGYGMTETGPLCLTQRMTLEELAQHLAAEADPVIVGSPAAGWSIRIVDDAGSVLPAGVAGNIEVSSDTKLFSGYRDDLELTQASFSEDGWFKTGDVGIVALGGLAITGRKKATIIINARNIALESIEAPARQIDGIYASLVAAAPVRLRDSATEELALFFVPRSEDIVDDLCRRMVQETARHSGVTVKHLVPLELADFPLTPTGKIRRNVLVDLYQSGMLAPHRLSRSADADAEHPLTETQKWLTELWHRILKLENSPSLHDNFFELGGDSLASAEIIFAVEEKFSCELPLEAFFERPTIASMDALLSQDSTPAAYSSNIQMFKSERLLHKLQSFSASWEGERLFRDGLVVGFNTDGGRIPIFWVCQGHFDASQLAKHLGPDQPLYAMRSCTEILAVKDYTAEALEPVCNRYLWEVLALQTGTAFILGGSCQGGMLALSMARRLTQMRRAPQLLVLLEWTYSYGSYAGPTLLIYGEQSYAAKVYRYPEKSKVSWVDDFPQRVVASIPGEHGELSQGDSVAKLAKILHEATGHDRFEIAESAAKIKNLQVKLGQRETKLGRLETEIGQLRASLLLLEQQLAQTTAALERQLAHTTAALDTLSGTIECMEAVKHSRRFTLMQKLFWPLDWFRSKFKKNSPTSRGRNGHP